MSYPSRTVERYRNFSLVFSTVSSIIERERQPSVSLYETCQPLPRETVRRLFIPGGSWCRREAVGSAAAAAAVLDLNSDGTREGQIPGHIRCTWHASTGTASPSPPHQHSPAAHPSPPSPPVFPSPPHQHFPAAHPCPPHPTSPLKHHPRSAINLEISGGDIYRPSTAPATAHCFRCPQLLLPTNCLLPLQLVIRPLTEDLS